MGLSLASVAANPSAADRDRIRLTARGQGLPDGAPHRAPKQAALVSRLKSGPLPLAELKTEGFSPAVMRALKDHTLVEDCELATEAAWQTRSPPLPANAEQQSAIDQIVARQRPFRCICFTG